MQNFKEGDRVRLETGKGVCFIGDFTLEKCSPQKCGNTTSFHTVDDNGTSICHCNPSSWILISSANKKPMANKITNIARGLLDEDYKKLIKVGWLNSDLSLTELGRDTVLSRYLMKNKEAFGEMAGELLEEQKEDCK